MKRKIDAILQDWAKDDEALPLLLRGVRRVGKTYCAQALGENTFRGDFVLFDFQTDLERLSLIFDGPTETNRLIGSLSIYAGKQITAGKTLIIFDEVQLCEKALNSLRFFAESPYKVVATGSQLGLTLKQRTLPFPSDVRHVYLHPLDFEEFLWGMGEQRIADGIRQAFVDRKPFVLHEEALALYKEYLIVGGMPKPLDTYVSTRDFAKVRQRQADIDEIYLADISLHAPNDQATRIRMIWQSIPAQLARESTRKFKYSDVERGARSEQFEGPIGWLDAAEMINLNRQTTQTRAPLEPREGSFFKIFMEDTGLLFRKYNLNEQAFLDTVVYQTLSANFRGALAENYTMQALVANNITTHYWVGKNTTNEVEFIFANDRGQLVPIEVKSGSNVRARSLRVFLEKSQTPNGIRLSTKNFGLEDGICSIPLYAAFCIDRDFG